MNEQLNPRPDWVLWRRSPRCFEGDYTRIQQHLVRRGYVLQHVDGPRSVWRRPRSGRIVLLRSGVVFAHPGDAQIKSAIRVLAGFANTPEPTETLEVPA